LAIDCSIMLAAAKAQSTAFWDNSTLDGPDLVTELASSQLLATPKWPSWTPDVLTGRWAA
jgi:predicted ABC-type ATPase